MRPLYQIYQIANLSYVYWTHQVPNLSDTEPYYIQNLSDTKCTLSDIVPSRIWIYLILNLSDIKLSGYRTNLIPNLSDTGLYDTKITRYRTEPSRCWAYKKPYLSHIKLSITEPIRYLSVVLYLLLLLLLILFLRLYSYILQDVSPGFQLLQYHLILLKIKASFILFLLVYFAENQH